jgi:hypothetical protein
MNIPYLTVLLACAARERKFPIVNTVNFFTETDKFLDLHMMKNYALAEMFDLHGFFHL